MKFHWTKAWVWAAVGTLACGRVATANPLVNLQIQGSTDGGTTYSNIITATPGQSVLFRVIGNLILGATNTKGPSTITQLVEGTDGITSLKFDLVDNGGTGGAAGFQAPSLVLQSGFALGSGHAVGTLTGNTLGGVRPAENPGVYHGANTPAPILTGTFVVDTNTTESITGNWTSNGSGGIQFNNGANPLIPNNTSETGADHIVAFAPLTINTPEPASLSLLAVGTLALARRRRR